MKPLFHLKKLWNSIHSGPVHIHSWVKSIFYRENQKKLLSKWSRKQIRVLKILDWHGPALGDTKKAEEKVKEITTQTHGNISYLMAIIWAQHGEKDKAMELLEQAYKEKDVWLIFLKGDPRLRSLENDPRHTALLRKMNLPVD